MQRLLLVKYGEIHLKGLNRPYFKSMLKKRLRENLQGLNCQLFEQQGRVYVYGYEPQDEAEAILRVKRTFGVHAVCAAVKVEKELSTIYEAAKAELERALAYDPTAPRTFKVKARRQDKAFPLNSDAICRDAGGYLLHNIENMRVDVHNPRFEVEIEIRDMAYVYVHEEKGVGGMPVGCNGKVALMLSGGIDSPVAGYMLAKRGLSLEAVHFQSPPYTGEPAKQKVLDLAQELAVYCGPIPVHLVHFTDVQEQIYEKCQDNLLTVIMRRFMVRVCEGIAQEVGAGGMVTGESLGQVASQTLDALRATNHVADLPVFRPLIGMDKSEIVEIAKRIGTFETSIRPGEDCCTVFVPRHPSTHPDLAKIVEEEKKLDVDALVKQCIESRETVIITA